MLRACLSIGVAVAVLGTGLGTASPVASADLVARTVRLTGDGTALVMGPSGFPIPPQSYVDAADSLFLRPHGFTGTGQVLFTPEGLNPVTGVKSLPTDTSFAQGQQMLTEAVQSQLTGGHVNAANPVFVFGWSQSSSVSSFAMTHLAEAGVPSADVHFVLLGDPSNANGGALERFDVPAGTDPSFPSLGITFSGATPADLYPTDIYTAEYDGFADFPQYPINLLADINAFFGLLLAHGLYFGYTPEQIASAIRLPTSTSDGLTDYYMLPAPGLPMLDLLQLLPVIGQPLDDLLEPDMRILVNLGYGSITDGWSQGPADVPTAFGLFPTNINPAEVFSALGNGLQQGVTDAVKQLGNPDNYRIGALPPDSALAMLAGEASKLGFDTGGPPRELLDSLLGFTGFPSSDATLLSPPAEIVNALTGTLSGDYATLLPVTDTATAILTGLPLYDANLFAGQLADGNIIAALGDPIAADTALIPFAVLFGTAAPIGEAALGTMINLLGLIP